MRRYRWWGIAPGNLDWWGAFSYTVGVGMYWVAAVSTMINDCPNSLMAPDVYVSSLSHHRAHHLLEKDVCQLN